MIKLTFGLLAALMVNTATAGDKNAMDSYDCMAPGLEQIYSVDLDLNAEAATVAVENGGGTVMLQEPHLDFDLDESGTVVAYIVSWKETVLSSAGSIEPSQTLVIETNGFATYKKANIGQTKMICVSVN